MEGRIEETRRPTPPASVEGTEHLSLGRIHWAAPQRVRFYATVRGTRQLSAAEQTHTGRIPSGMYPMP